MKRVLWVILILGSCISCRKFEEVSFVALEVDFTPSLFAIQEGGQITFVQKSSIVAENFFWDFDDNGSTSEEPNPTHQFNQRGLYRVKLVASKKDRSIKDSITRNILVLPSTTSDSPISTVLGESNIDEVAYNFAKVSDGYVLVGRRSARTLLIKKINFDMVEQWSKSISNLSETASQIFAQSILPTSDNGFVVVGFFKYNEKDDDAFILKLDANRNEIWRRRLNTKNNEQYKSVVEVNNQYIVGGTIINEANTESRIVLDLYSQAGVPEGSKVFESIEWRLNDLKTTSDGGFIMAINAKLQPALVKLTPSRDFDWITSSEQNNFIGLGTSVAQLSDGDFVTVGALLTNKTDSTHAYIARYSDGGTRRWFRSLLMYHEYFGDVVQFNNELLVSGVHFNPISKDDVLFCKYDANTGNLTEEVKLFGNELSNVAFRISLLDNSGIFYTIGGTEESYNGQRNFYIIKRNAND